MFEIYLPDALYERLPTLYLLTALALFISPLGGLKWIAILALALAALLTHVCRREYRRHAGRSPVERPPA